MNNQCTNHTNLWIAIPKCVSSDKSFVLGNKGVKTTLDPVFRSVIVPVVSEEMLKKNLTVNHRLRMHEPHKIMNLKTKIKKLRKMDCFRE